MKTFIEREKQRILVLTDTEESFHEWYNHYQTLSPKEKAVADYLLTVAGKDSFADDYMGLDLCPVSCVNQVDVNNGYGVLYAIRRECFPAEDVKLCFLRSDMWVASKEEIPRWILSLEEEICRYSSGLGKVRIEVVSYAFRDEIPCDYYAITFHLEAPAIRDAISIFGEQWDTEKIGKYVLALTDISGEFDYVLGDMTKEGILPLWKCSVDFK
ncbi:MAG: hypothetical protein II993_04810 [Anaerotignum sp.]|nr:hypothetical protein [Anaerotignum sp.]MBQ3615308.1 hypothetical protein [Anaerotignum sp.]MBR2851075.1 hypothetical protein [Anaerotignum sp.]